MKMNERCNGCGSTVSDRFAKVFGDDEDEVHHCMNCINLDEGGRSALRHGAAAMPDFSGIKSLR